MKTVNTRVMYLDLLRIVAAIAVVCLHVAGTNWEKATVYSFEWTVNAVYNGAVRFSVPIFLMVSGIFFLDPDREIGIKDLYSKNIIRLIVAFLSWSLFYLLVNFKQYDGVKWAIRELIYGHYHMWFLYMMVGIYIIVPFLRQIVKKTKYMEYFLIVTFIFTFLIPTTVSLFPFLDLVYKRMYFYFTLGYTGYFVLGRYLYETKISPKIEVLIYVLGIIGVLISILVSIFVSRRNGVPSAYWSELSINVLLEVISVFTLFKCRLSRIQMSDQVQIGITKLSKYTFGVYLIHPFILERINEIGLTTTSFNTILVVPVITLIVFLLSVLVTHVFHLIPFVRKYLV